MALPKANHGLHERRQITVCTDTTVLGPSNSPYLKGLNCLLTPCKIIILSKNASPNVFWVQTPSNPPPLETHFFAF